MTQAPKSPHLQLNLFLIQPSQTTVLGDPQKELETALAELLLRAAQEHVQRLENEKPVNNAQSLKDEVHHES